MTMPDWRDPGYLRAGTPRQRRAASVLEDIGVLSALKAYDPILTGTVPIGLDVPTSDLDIVCDAADLDTFAAAAAALEPTDDFDIHHRRVRSGPAIIARFSHRGERIELFAQSCPSERQDAYRHMVAEWRLLCLGGDRLRRRILSLKRRGWKTEPAVASLLGLDGDPFLAVLGLENLSDDDLSSLIDKAMGTI